MPSCGPGFVREAPPGQPPNRPTLEGSHAPLATRRNAARMFLFDPFRVGGLVDGGFRGYCPSAGGLLYEATWGFRVHRRPTRSSERCETCPALLGMLCVAPKEVYGVG